MSGTLPSGTGSVDESPAFDTSVAHSARVYDYWLGGKDNFAEALAPVGALTCA